MHEVRHAEREVQVLNAKCGPKGPRPNMPKSTKKGKGK
jgi:hypothetical protein